MIIRKWFCHVKRYNNRLVVRGGMIPLSIMRRFDVNIGNSSSDSEDLNDGREP